MTIHRSYSHLVPKSLLIVIFTLGIFGSLTPQPALTAAPLASVMSAADAAFLQPNPVLDVAKEAVKPLAPQTGFAIYKITVTNNGTANADGVQITDSPALAGFTYSDGIADSVTLLGGATQTAVVSPANGDANPVWGDFSIPVGGSVEILFGMQVEASTPLGNANNSASVTTSTFGTVINNFDGNTTADDDVQVTTPPFTCDSSQYIVTGNADSELFRIDRSTSPFTFEPIGPPTSSAHYPNTFKLNGLAYNPFDNYMYATVSGGNGAFSTYDIVRIDANGTPTNIGSPGAFSGTYAGAFAGDGTYLVGGGRTMNTFDVNSAPPVKLSTVVFPGGNSFTDFAVDPTDPTPNRFYFVNESGANDTVCYGDYTTGTVDGCLPNPTGFNHNAGSQFFDGLGNLYYRSNSDTNVYLVDMDAASPTYGVATLVSSAPTGGNHDGASCAFEVFMEKEVSPENAAPGDIVTYTYTIANSSAEPLSGLIFTDTMDAGRTFIGGTLVNPLGGTPIVGSNTITITDGVIPQSSIVEIQIDAQLPAPMVGGTVYNQANLAGLSTTYGGSIVSDYVASAEELDPTPLKIAALGLAKNVKTGPTFTADGAFDVTYELILENIGDTELHDLQITDDLATPFGTYEVPAVGVDAENEYTIKSVVIATDSADGLALNPSFDGSANQALLDGDTGSLAVGETAVVELTVTFFADFTAGSPVTYNNQASASGDIPENNNGTPDSDVTDLSDNGTATDANGSRYANEAGENDITPIEVSSAASINIVKTVAPDTNVEKDDVLTYTFTITNDGNLPINAVQFTDPLPGLGTITCANTSDGDVFTNDGTQQLIPTESVVCTAPYTVTQTDIDTISSTIDNTATVTGTATDTTPVTDNDTAQATTLNAPAINIIKSVDDPTPTLGQLVTYTYTVQNTGNRTLNPVVVTDAHGGSDPLSAITCDASSLAPAASTTCSATYTVTQTDVNAGSVLNTATATGTPPAGPNVTATDTAELKIEAFPGISLVKSADNTSPANGTLVTYSYAVKNTGNVTLDPVVVTDIHNGNAALSAISCPATLLAPDASMTCTATYTVNLDDVNDGLVTNTATVNGTPPSGPNVSDSDSEQLTIAPDPAISLSKTPNVALLDAGDNVTYTYTVTNNGNVTLNPVTITDVHEGDNPLSPISCPQTILNPGDSMDCTATYTVNQVDVDTELVSNTATVSGKPPAGANVTAEDTAIIEFPPGPIIGIEKGVSNLTPAAGETITYRYEVSNIGNVTLYSINVTDIHNGSGSLSAIFCPMATLARDESMTCTATYTVTQADIDSGNLDNTVTVNAESPSGTEVTDNDTLELLFPANPNITLVKTANVTTDVAVDDVITYSFVVENTGNVTLNPISVTDPLEGLSVVSCPVTTLAPATATTCTATYTVTQDDVDTGQIDNTAGVSGTPPVGDPVADTDTEIVTTEAADPAIQIEKSADPAANGAVDDVITYSFVVTNVGNVTLDTIAVTDPLPNLSAISCPATTLAPTISMTCTATYTVTQPDVDAGSIDNEATVTGEDPNDTPVDDKDNISTPLIAADPGISLRKSVAPNTELALGDNLTYTFIAENTGNVTLNPVTITDPLAGLGTITCDASVLAPGAIATCTAPYTVSQTDIDNGQIVNNASVTGIDPNGALVDSKADATALTLRDPGLYFDKTADVTENLEVGDLVTFTFETGNTGNVTLNNVEVVDTSLPGLSAITCNNTSLGDVFANDGTDSLDPNETVICSATYTMAQADIDNGFAENLASTSGEPSNGDPTLSDDDTELLTTLQNPALTLTKVGDIAGGLEKDDVVTYTFTITNTGNMTITAVELSDPLPGLSAFTCGNTSEATPFLNDGSDDLIPGESVACTATYTVTQADVDAGHVLNTATVMGNDPNSDPVQDQADEDIPAAQTPVISLAKSVDDAAPALGDTLTYSYLVSNAGNVTLDEIAVTDVHSGSDPLSAISCPFTELAPGNAMTCTATYVVTQADVDAGTLDNTATVNGQTPSDTPVTDTDALALEIPASPLIDLTKTADNNTPVLGETVTYTYTVRNNGNVTLNTVGITDVHPGVGALSAIDCPADTLAPTASMVCSATYTVLQGDIDNESLTNVATVTATPPIGAPITDIDDETLLFDAYPLIDVAKAVSNATPLAGDLITYTYTVSNTGTVTLTNVGITDVHSGSNPLGTITCGATTLLPTQSTECSALYTVSQADVDAGLLTNTATGAGTTPDASIITEDDDITIEFDPVPSIGIVKTVDNNTPVLGEIVTYSYAVTNTGNVTLNNILVTDAHGGFVALSAITCPTDTLAPAASMTCTATYAVQQEDIDATTVSNTATVVGDPPIGAQINATDDAILVFDSRPLIDLKKSATLTSAGRDDVVTYVYEVTNIGTVSLTSVGVTDTHSGSDPLSAITCGTDALLPGEGTTCTATYTVTQLDVNAGTLTNTAEASGTAPDTSVVNDSDDWTVDLPQGPMISLDKTVSNSTPLVGETITYSYAVTNTGNVTLSNVGITDVHGGVSAWPGVTCAETTLAPDASTTCTADYVVDQGDIDAGNISNLATVSADPPIGDPVTDTSDEDIIFEALPLLAVVKTASDTAADAGETITYTYLVTNNGNVTLTAIGVTDVHGGAGTLVDGGCDVTVIAPTEVATCTATYEVTQPDVDAGAVTNIVTASGTPPVGDPVTDTDDEEVRFPPGAAILLEKTVDNTAPSAGETVTYSYTVTNTGNVTLPTVTLTDVHGGTGTFTQPVCPEADLDRGESMVCSTSYTVTQDDVDSGNVSNTATAVGTPAIGDPVNSSDTEELIFPPAPSLILQKTADNTADTVVDDVITYTFSLFNTGNLTLKNVRLSDPLPGLSTLSCANTSNADPFLNDGTDTLSPGENVTCTATYTVTQADIDNGLLSNTATATAASLTDTPVETTDTHEIPFAQLPDLILDKSVDVVEATEGDTVNFSFTLRNAGNVTLTEVRLLDPFDGLGAITCGLTTNADAFANDGSDTLDPGEAVTCTAPYLVTAADAAQGELENLATVYGIDPEDDYQSDVNSALFLVEEPPVTPTPTPEPDPTATPEPDATATATPDPAATATSTAAPTATPEPTATSDPAATATPTTDPAATATATPAVTETPTIAPTATNVGAATATQTPVATDPTATITPTPITPTVTPTTAGPTATPTATAVAPTPFPTAVPSTLTPTAVPPTAVPTPNLNSNVAGNSVEGANGSTQAKQPSNSNVAGNTFQTNLLSLIASKQASPSFGFPGDTITYTINITNPNGVTVDNVIISDLFDTRLNPLTATATRGNARIEGRSLLLNLDRMIGNETVTITVQAQINASAIAPDQIPNTASVLANDTQPGYSNTASVQVIPPNIPTTGALAAAPATTPMERAAHLMSGLIAAALIAACGLEFKQRMRS